MSLAKSLCGEFEISTSHERLDLEVIHGFLASSYWSKGISSEVVARSIQGSLCFGLYRGPSQIGFARVITDSTTFAYLADVFVLESYRRQGLGKWLIQTIIEHPQLQDLRRFMLFTSDAHDLYSRFGFEPIEGTQNGMHIYNGLCF